jgi:hypothetical protein
MCGVSRWGLSPFVCRLAQRDHSSAEKLLKPGIAVRMRTISLSVAASRLARFEMQADGYLVALRESDDNTEVVAVALKEGPRRFASEARKASNSLHELCRAH